MHAVLNIKSLMNTNLLCLQTSVKQYMGKKNQDIFIRIRYLHCATKRLSLYFFAIERRATIELHND